MGRRVTAALGLALALVATACRVIEREEVGVAKNLGSISDEPLGPGLALHLPPLREVVVWHAGIQKLEENLEVPTSEGFIVRLGLSLYFRLERDRAPELRRTTGADYVAALIHPVLRATTRNVASGHPASEFHAEKNRNEIARVLGDALREMLEPRGIEVLDVRLHSVESNPRYLEAPE